MTKWTTKAEAFARFMRLVAVGQEPGSCWIWQGNRPDGRYGHFSITGKSVKAHRWLYEAVIGFIPDGLVLRHRCDNPACVNPQHLELGTFADNTRDMLDRGRGADRKGERHPLARLNADSVRKIRAEAANGTRHAALAERFGVARQQITKIVGRASWGHIQ